MSRGLKRGAAPRSRLFVVQYSRGFVREVVPVALALTALMTGRLWR